MNRWQLLQVASCSWENELEKEKTEVIVKVITSSVNLTESVTNQEKNNIVFEPVEAKVGFAGPTPPELIADTLIMYMVYTARSVRVVMFIV